MKEIHSISRIDQIDTMRVIAAWLRCILHTLVPFMVYDTGIWVIHYDNVSNYFPDFMVLSIHSFIMEAFFIIAGLIFILEFEKKGMNNYIKSRFKKIVIPFILGILILVPFIAILFSISSSIVNEDFHWQFSNWISEGIKNWSSQLFVLAHLWFLYYLIIYYILVIAIMKFTQFKLVISSKTLKTLLWLSLPVIFTCLVFSKKWYIENPMTTHVEWNSLIYYLVFFLLGILIKPYFINLNLILNYKRWIISIFVVSSLSNAALQTFYKNPDPDHQEIIRYSALISTLIQTVSGIFLLYIISFRNKYKETPFYRFQVRSAYWTYIIHVPIVMIIQIALFPIQIHLIFKFLIAFIGSMSIAFLLYPFFGRKLLNL